MGWCSRPAKVAAIFFGGRADERHRNRPWCQGVHERSKVAVFVQAAKNDVQPGRKSLDGHLGRCHIRGLGVVEVPDSANFRHKLQPVFQPAKVPDGCPGGFRRDASGKGDSQAGQDVFHIVPARQRQVGAVKQHPFGLPGTAHQIVSTQKKPFFQFPLG